MRPSARAACEQLRGAVPASRVRACRGPETRRRVPFTAPKLTPVIVIDCLLFDRATNRIITNTIAFACAFATCALDRADSPQCHRMPTYAIPNPMALNAWLSSLAKPTQPPLERITLVPSEQCAVRDEASCMLARQPASPCPAILTIACANLGDNPAPAIHPNIFPPPRQLLETPTAAIPTRTHLQTPANLACATSACGRRCVWSMSARSNSMKHLTDSPGEGNHVSDVAHGRRVKHEALEAHAEA